MKPKKLFNLILILFFISALTFAQDQNPAKKSEKQCCEKSEVKKAGDCLSKDKTSKADKSSVNKTRECCNKEKSVDANKSKTKATMSSDCCMEKSDAKKADCQQKSEKPMESKKQE